MERVNITLDGRTVDLLNLVKKLTGASKSEIIRRGVESYFREVSGLERPPSLNEQILEAKKRVQGDIKSERKRVATRKRS